MTLAPIARRQQVFSTAISPSSSPALSFFYNDDDDILSQSDSSSYIPSPLDFSHCTPTVEEFFADSRQSTPYEQSTYDSPDSEIQFMPDGSSQNPRLLLQQSISHGLPDAYTPPPMNTGSYQPQTWNGQVQNFAHLNPNHPQHHRKIAFRSHKRVSSGSSAASAGPDSPYTQTSDYPHIVDTDAQNSPHQLDPYENFYTTAEQFAKPLVAATTPLDAPVLFPPNFSINPSVNQYAGSSSMMRSRPGAQMQDRSTMSANGNYESGSMQADFELGSEMRNAVPNLDRTMSDVYQDQTFNPAIVGSTNQSQAVGMQGALLSPSYMNNERLQAANAAGPTSPPSHMARDRSPFGDESDYSSPVAATPYSQGPNSPAARINSAARIRAQQKADADVQAYAQHHPQLPRHDLVASTTVSPKETTYRDYHESEDEARNNFALFPPQDLQLTAVNNAFPSSSTSSRTTRRPNTSASVQEQYGIRTGPSDYTSQPSNSNDFPFMAPNVPGLPQQYPFISHSRRQSSSMRSQTSDQIPEFPATLSSMESTKSEGGAPETVRPPAFVPQSLPSSQEEKSSSSSPLQRPADTTAHSGSYQCVDCPARFETSSKLQKHRREIHRANSPLPSTTATSSNPATPSSSTSANATPAKASQTSNSQAAANNISRNNAPGPHKCTQVNPSTGKPCNTTFSRSYDLTRHEETIHSGRKTKVRCQLCTETKTFSRNDALTRHMRVVHPDVEFSGKSSRRGGRS